MQPIRYITVHHDAIGTMSSGSAADTADRLERIRRSHVQRPGFADIGYHYAIDPAGRVWEARTLGLQGAHVANRNPGNIGICVLGHYNLQHVAPASARSLDAFVGALMARHRVPLGNVLTHQEWAPTECPGVHLQQYMNATRANSGRLAMLARDTAVT
jgi:hypothetical protein